MSWYRAGRIVCQVAAIGTFLFWFGRALGRGSVFDVPTEEALLASAACLMLALALDLVEAAAGGPAAGKARSSNVEGSTKHE